MKILHRTAVATAIAASFVASAHAQQQVVRPPIANYWMDVATHSMAGMEDMPGLSSLAIMGGGRGNAYGNTRGMSPGRWLDLALYTRNKPNGTDGSHAIPPGMRMGDSLPLVPMKPAPTPTREPGDVPEEYERERPSGRILIYWGCSETVRPGQPRILDLATAAPVEFGRALGGRHVPERGARVAPGYSLWPNETSRTMVPREASLNGNHAVSGDGVPASLRFAIGQAQDFMPPIQLTASGALTDSIALQWQPIATARAHYLHAMGTIGKDMVLWSSAEVPDTGMGLFDYLSNPTIDRWLQDKLLLPAAQTQCAIPKGIFAGGRDSSGMLRMIAYGSELNLVHPPRPTDPRTPWEQEWTARVRVKATTMSMLGSETGSRPRRPAAARAQEPASTTEQDTPQQATPQQEAPAASTPSIPGLPGLPGAGRAVDAIRGIFGR